MGHRANGTGSYWVLLIAIKIKYSLTILMGNRGLIISISKMHKDKDKKSRLLCQALAFKRNRKISTSLKKIFLNKINFIKMTRKANRS